MSDSGDSMQAAAVANAIRQEPSYHVVQFPTSGDVELDAISGMLSVMNALGLTPLARIACLNYLIERSHFQNKRNQDEDKRRQREAERMYQTAAKFPPGIGAGQAIGPITPPNPGDWTIGGAPYPGGLAPVTTAGQALANAHFQPGKGPVTPKTLCEVFMEEEKKAKNYATPPQIKR